MKRCPNCKLVKEEKYFFPREDTFGFYAWCIRCMNNNGRSPEYPPVKEQGHGVYHPNYRSLKPGYEEN